MVSKTRKIKKAQPSSQNSLTIPQLRKAFEHIDRFVESKILRLSEKEGLVEFRKEWKRTFGEISEESARDYLQYMRTRASKTNTHSQKGGAVTVLSPASLGYDMRGGQSDAALSYPAYVSSGFLEPPMDSVYATCGKPSAFLPPAADTGSNKWTPMAGGRRQGGRKSKTRKAKTQKGGSVGTSFAEFMARPFGMGSPPSILQDAGKLATGYNGFPSPKPEINHLPFTQPSTVFNASISPVTRIL
jgi:hypothetical protein